MSIGDITTRPSRTNAGMARDWWPLQFPDALVALNDEPYFYAGYSIMAASVMGQPAKVAGRVRHAIQVSGTFGSGDTIVVNGTLDGVNWAALGLYAATTPVTVATSIAAAGIYMVALQVPLVLITITGGTLAGSSLNVTIASRF